MRTRLYLKVAAVGRGQGRRLWYHERSRWLLSWWLVWLGPGHVTDIGIGSLLVALGGLDEFHPLIASRALQCPARLAEGHGRSNVMSWNSDIGVEQ